MKRLKRRLSSRGGFTLAELLIVILILLLVTGIVVEGIPLATRAYNRIVYSANAQVLLATASTVLRDELGTAVGDAKESADKKTIEYRSARTGAYNRISQSDGMIMIKEYSEYTSSGENTTRPLVSQTATESKLYSNLSQKLSLSYDTITYDKDTHIYTIAGLRVKKDDTELVKAETLEIRTINA